MSFVCARIGNNTHLKRAGLLVSDKDKPQKNTEETTPNPTFDYDAIVIGTGPGGEGAAMGLAKTGKSVAVVERHSAVGGGCTHWGTIPSKALRQSVSQLIHFNTNPLFSESGREKHFTFPQILKHAEGVIRQQTRLRAGFYDRNRVQLIKGEASFVDKHTLCITYPDGSTQNITAQTIVIATGSRPYRPTDVDFTSGRVYDSDTILSLKHDPRSIIIYGAGLLVLNMPVFSEGWASKLT